jgi:hypothetical protein
MKSSGKLGPWSPTTTFAFPSLVTTKETLGSTATHRTRADKGQRIRQPVLVVEGADSTVRWDELVTAKGRYDSHRVLASGPDL